MAEKFGFLAHEPTYGVHFFHAHFIHGRLLLLQSRFHVVVREITPYFVGLNGDKKKKAKAQTKRKNKRTKDSFLKCIDIVCMSRCPSYNNTERVQTRDKPGTKKKSNFFIMHWSAEYVMYSSHKSK